MSDARARQMINEYCQALNIEPDLASNIKKVFWSFFGEISNSPKPKCFARALFSTSMLPFIEYSNLSDAIELVELISRYTEPEDIVQEFFLSIWKHKIKAISVIQSIGGFVVRDAILSKEQFGRRLMLDSDYWKERYRNHLLSLYDKSPGYLEDYFQGSLKLLLTGNHPFGPYWGYIFHLKTLNKYGVPDLIKILYVEPKYLCTEIRNKLKPKVEAFKWQEHKQI